MKRIAILGGTGMAGHVAVAYLEEQGYNVFYMSGSAPHTEKSKGINAMHTHDLNEWLNFVEPDIIINCIGLLVTDSEKMPDKAIFLNAYLPRYLEQMYFNTSVKIIHLSTDCVFSGKHGGYNESDSPDGETVYDRSKALGEINNDKDLTFRMSIIGPDSNSSGTGLFNWFMKQQGDIQGFTKAIWNGVTTIELARAIDAALHQDLTGLYHLVYREPIDKYSLLTLFRDIMGKTDVNIEPSDNFVVDKTLVNTRTDFDFEVQTYPKQIIDMRDWILRNVEVYGHYRLQRLQTSIVRISEGRFRII